MNREEIHPLILDASKLSSLMNGLKESGFIIVRKILIKITMSRRAVLQFPGGHPKPPTCGHLKTAHLV
jgi:hypothetical protein